MKYDFLVGSTNRILTEHALHCIRTAERGSIFGKRIRIVRWLPDQALMMILFGLRYDGLLAHEDGEVIGHIFYQQHKNTYHVFSVWVKEGLRRRGIARTMMAKFLRHCGEQNSIDSIRLGTDTNPVMKKLREHMMAGEIIHDLPFTIVDKKGGWVDIDRNVIRLSQAA